MKTRPDDIGHGARFLCATMPDELNGLKKPGYQRVVELPADMRNYSNQIPKSGNSLQDFITRYIIDIMENLT
jgi:hypothetical protein